jgi:hypothetical protein
MLWFTNENPAYIRCLHDIVTTKFDINRMKIELSRLEQNRAQANQQAELLETNIEYIKKYAKVVSMREYTNLKHMLADEYAILLLSKNSIPSLERQIRIAEESLASLEARLPSFQSKVLEFKRRD